eukprot:Nitzschia sp. Nitz4//scaffold5_size260463//20937//21587//NITZ4_000940-RA/size260463-processed-gene-0.48-mRNA-1//1//CDS//3329555214//2040//frame0
MNSCMGIDLNNYAVKELKRGRLDTAYDVLSYACERTPTMHHQSAPTHQTYMYAWVDCSKALMKELHERSTFNEGCMSYLYLKFLTVEAPVSRDVGGCSCGYAWVLWYNLGIVSALMGSPIGSGNMLLRQSLELLQRVQSRVQPQPRSKHWSMLKLSVLNNQACVLSDLAMNDQILDPLVQMGLTLTKSSNVLDPGDQELFRWTVTKLVEDRFAPAA